MKTCPKYSFNDARVVNAYYLPTSGCINSFADALFQRCHNDAKAENPNNSIGYQISISIYLDEIVEALEDKDMTYVQSMMFDAIVHMRDREAEILKSMMKALQSFDNARISEISIPQTRYISFDDRMKLVCQDLSYVNICLGLW